MVTYCVICNEKFVKGSEISFHKFPKTEERRKLWTSACKPHKAKAKIITSSSVVCSQHFTNDDFLWDRQAGLRILTKDAVPTIFTEKHKISNSSNLTNVQTSTFVIIPSTPALNPVQNSVTQNIITPVINAYDKFQNNEIKESRKVILQKDIGIMCKLDSDVQVELCSCVQDSIKSTEEQVISEKIIDAPSQRKIWRPARLGDMSDEHFSTPKTANANFAILKSKIISQRKTIRMLNQKNRRLQKKMQSLKTLLEHLRCKHFE